MEPLPSLSAAELQGKMIRDVDISGHQSAQETPALELAGRLHVTLSTADGSLRLRPLARLWQPVPESEYYKDEGQRHLVVHAVAVQARHGEADAALREPWLSSFWLLRLCFLGFYRLYTSCSAGDLFTFWFLGSD